MEQQGKYSYESEDIPPEIREEFHKYIERFELAFKLFPDEPEKIAAMIGGEWVEDGCDGDCPECEQKKECEVYKEDLWKEGPK